MDNTSVNGWFAWMEYHSIDASSFLVFWLALPSNFIVYFVLVLISLVKMILYRESCHLFRFYLAGFQMHIQLNHKNDIILYLLVVGIGRFPKVSKLEMGTRTGAQGCDWGHVRRFVWRRERRWCGRGWGRQSTEKVPTELLQHRSMVRQ